METIRSRKPYELVFSKYIGNSYGCPLNNCDVAGAIVKRKMGLPFLACRLSAI